MTILPLDDSDWPRSVIDDSVNLAPSAGAIAFQRRCVFRNGQRGLLLFFRRATEQSVAGGTAERPGQRRARRTPRGAQS